MPKFKIPLNYVEVKDYEVEADSLAEAVDRVECLIDSNMLDSRVTSISYRQLLLGSPSSSEERQVEISFEDWLNEYKPIVNPFNLRTLCVEVSPWDAYFFNSSNEDDLSITRRTSMAFVWTVLKDSCNKDNPYKAFYVYFSANHDFEQAANYYEEGEDIVWSPYLSVAGYFIATKVPPTTDKTLFVKL